MLWKETEVIPGSPETVNKFKELGKKFFYITNNNTKTRSEFVEKCKGLKYDATLVNKIHVLMSVIKKNIYYSKYSFNSILGRNSMYFISVCCVP